ncbi:hypothetical protein [Nocardioides yefusunii]|uniref:DUF222 domain-containing protein n=1 Tax=Nocardioides yefusunii TaxID=2500546 RepID=A0ABW1QT20_9ACTN|nr:hypothetical protein [Nocardioides yefusunii]
MSTTWDPALVDLVHLWRVDPVGHTQPLLETAATLVTAGTTSPALERLAAEGPDASRGGVHRMVTELQHEMGLGDITGEDAQQLALAAMTRRHITGHVTHRELTYWVTRVIGLRGGESGRIFLQLEQQYCDRLGEADVTDIDTRVHDEATALAEGRRSPSAPPLKKGLLGLLRRR